MATGQGFAGICGLSSEATYRTALAPDELCPFISEGFSKEFERIAQDYMIGKAGASVDDQAPGQVVGAPLSVPIVYDTITGAIFGVDLLFGLALGSGAYASNRSEYSFTAQIDESATISFDKQVSVHEVVSAKVATMEITGSSGGDLRANFTFNAHNLRVTGDAGIVVVVGDLTGLAPTVQPEKALFSDLTVRIADDANALAAGDKIKINNFTLSLNNNLSDPTFSTPENSGHTDSSLSEEYERNGFREVTLSIELPRYEADTFLTHLKNDEKLTADIVATDGSDEFSILIPTLKVTDWKGNIDGPDLMPVTVEFMLFLKHPDNTDMAFASSNAITAEFAIETKNARTTHAFA